MCDTWNRYVEALEELRRLKSERQARIPRPEGDRGNAPNGRYANDSTTRAPDTPALAR